MTTTTTRRRCAAATIAVLLLLLPGCAALSELTSADPASGSSPSTAESPTPAASVPASPTPEPTAPADPTPSDTPTPEPTPSAEATPSPSPTPTASAPAEESEAEGTDDAAKKDQKKKDEKKQKKTPEPEPEPQYLQVGATGAEVSALQERLVELGYYLPGVDGVFGPMTQQAVWALQKSAGLYRDAVVGPNTEAALDDGVRPSPVSSSGKVVEIDLDRQLLLAVEDGRVVRTFNASSGNGETFEAKGRTYRATTPTGTYAVYMERDYLHESTLELGSMYRPKYFTGGIAVHGSGSIPPYPASHGCIRVSNSAMNWLWDSWGMPQGTTVVVH
ncbi:hypothetical protein GCM10023216_32130 [Isoptericola chiayiensis]|uniref:L,D-TPase catalytic domain-containing protein n=1 Tax=Isoptericola chiayiensis TaxID=579446 RepID=A0ABP8YU14_9MICO|nr:L,D-transpeptidase family protein [Isoptericola chiayiensis]NOW01791.1 lipoprotein-anchoring transpeptidase ErfK/SrfK [Isoptericola chiayiensis]